MKKSILLIASVSAIALLTACGTGKKNADSSSVNEAEVTTTYATNDTSMVTTSTTTSLITSLTTTATTASSEATASETTAATEPKEYTHKFEIMNTAFGTRLEPKISEEELSAFLYSFCVAEDNRYLFACVRYGNEETAERSNNYSLYRIDLETEEVLFCGETYDVWDNGFVPHLYSDYYGLYALGEKAALFTYNGVYVGDEVTHKLVTVVDKWNAEGCTAYIGSTRFVTTYPLDHNPDSKIKVYDYDAVTNTITIHDNFPKDFEGRLCGEILLVRSDNQRHTTVGEEGGEQKIIFEWN